MADQKINSQYNILFQETFIQEAIPQFVRKVFMLVQFYKEIICWSEDGKTIIIKDPFRLNREILPEVFHQNTMRSFIRQLNMYNFKKIRRRDSQKELYFKNPHMMKGNIQELVLIKRKKRGYVEQFALENKQARNIYDKYSIFVYGILTKLSKLLGVSNKNTLLPSQLPKFMKDVLEFCCQKASDCSQDSSRVQQTLTPSGLLQDIDEISDQCSMFSQIPLFQSSLNLFDQIIF